MNNHQSAKGNAAQPLAHHAHLWSTHAERAAAEAFNTLVWGMVTVGLIVAALLLTAVFALVALVMLSVL